MSSREDDLIAEIESAFADVRLEDGISLNMTEYNDSGGSNPRYLERAKHDERDDWRRIADETLENFRVTFSFTDLKGYRFYLPAYMIWTLRHHRTSDSPIANSTIYALDPDSYQFDEIPFTSWFTATQLSVIGKFLAYCRDDDETLNSPVATTNLAKLKIRPTTK